MQPSKVLIVDDMLVNVKILEKIVQDLGYETATALSGAAALELVKKEQFHCILLDILMPEMSGFDCIRELKSDPQYSAVPVIFITGEEGPESVAKGFELGAVDYVTKPFHALEIRARVQSHIKLFLTIQSLAHAQAETLQQIHSAQNSLLKKSSDFPKAAFEVYYKSLHAAGGDIYEIIEIAPEVYGYFVGDISGHEISTSFLTSSVKALLQQNCTSFYTPAESMRLVNKVLAQLMPAGLYLTAIYLVVDQKKMTCTVVSMGHTPAIFLPCTDEPLRNISMRGDVLGVFEDPMYRERVYKILPGDRLVLYTDGLIEGENVWSHNVDDLLTICGTYKESSRKQFLETIMKETAPLREGGDDDILLLVIDVPGIPPEITVELMEDGVTLALPSTRRLVSSAVERVGTAIASLAKIDKNELYGLQLVLHEAFVNAVVHGNKEILTKIVDIRVSVPRTQEVVIVVRDQGKGFAWQEVVDKITHWPDGDSGRGILIFKKYGFSLAFNVQGSELTLSKVF